MKSSIAKMQYKLGAGELAIVLALVRGGTLAAAGERLGVDASTVFRALQRLERAIGQRLFERSRAGYAVTELALALAEQAEHIESALEAARSASQADPTRVAGSVRLSTTDTILHALVAPALRALQPLQPALSYEIHTGNELTNLTRRDADLAVRATRRPPPHLIGKRLGPIRLAVYAARGARLKRLSAGEGANMPWIAPDDALPEHPSVLWRRRHLPKVVPVYRVNSILTVAELVALGCGIGIVPMFLAQGRSDLKQISEELTESETDLWLLAHPDTRHLRRVSAVYTHLAASITLP